MKKNSTRLAFIIILIINTLFGISQNDSISFSLTKPLCYGNCNGSIVASVSGTNAPYTFLWSTAATVDSIGGLCAGNYTLIITNSNSVITTSVVSLTQPDQFTSFSYCGFYCGWIGANSSTVCVNFIGGTAPYTYNVIDINNNTVLANYSGNCFFVPMGAYNVIASDSNNCQAALYGNYVILDSTNCYTTLTSPTCSTCCDGIVQLNFINPCPTCTSTLYQGGITYTSSTNTFTNVCLGAYTITATNFGCPSTFIDTLSRPVIVTTITEAYNAKDFEIFPNPTDGIVIIKHSHAVGQILIFNTLGIVVMKISTERSVSSIIDLSTFEEGIYMIQFTDKNNQVITHKKFILQ